MAFDFKNMICFGVAGNFAGHLEQAGEAADFISVQTEEEIQPKAIFPFYVPSETLNPEHQFLATFPLTHDQICFPKQKGADNLQIEPEIALICDIEYQEKQVISLTPRFFTAYNDCSIRRPDAKKISEKKNWGEKTKGLANTLLPLSSFALGCELDHYHIACFHKRGTDFNEYGIDSPALGYSYFHQKLLNWIITKMNTQPDQGPMNDIPALLAKANYPKQAVIGIGATRYTAFGERNFLQIGDTSIVVVYNAKKYDHETIVSMAKQNTFAEGIAALVQVVV
ncbi:TPA: DUF5718 family protein [Pasteurella multocida]|uniref:DUF5718 family protein n=1 Tax=Pasteurella multocida TaxID=747 RepID=UPI00189A987E|nr:DUF5718 family protein [Pasteurella multocida]MBF6982834.1 hypothetical protein [Pasteurella multocida]